MFGSLGVGSPNFILHLRGTVGFGHPIFLVRVHQGFMDSGVMDAPYSSAIGSCHLFLAVPTLHSPWKLLCQSALPRQSLYLGLFGSIWYNLKSSNVFFFACVFAVFA